MAVNPLGLNFLQSARPADVPMSALRRFPETEEHWHQRYNWLWDSYNGEPYSDGDHRMYGLFKALDDNEELIQQTRRLTRDVQHVVDTDVRAMAGPRLSLEPSTTGSAQRTQQGQDVWRRSRWIARQELAARLSAGLGDVYLEPQIPKDGGPARIVIHDPRFVTPVYDAQGIDLESATIKVSWIDDRGILHTEVRQMDNTSIRTHEVDSRSPGDIAINEEATGEHKLGRVPLVHVPFQLWGPPEHGLWAAPALEPVLAHIDSHMAQLRAISNRFADPKMIIKGARLDDSSSIKRFGRIIHNLDPDASVEYLEAGLTAIASLWQAIREYKEDVRHTVPEFTFAGSGANTSGRALDFRADQFRLKMEGIRARWFAGIAIATQLCILLDERSTFDPNDLWFRIAAPPVLPIDTATRPAQIQGLFQSGLLRKVDAVRQLQAIGVIDEEKDPDLYVRDLEMDADARTPEQLKSAPAPDPMDAPDPGFDPDEQQEMP